ncbi:MAG: ABC transporter ATP-binding protein [Lachnospiraceae bacterium]
MIEIENVSKTYKEKGKNTGTTVLNKVSLQIQDGEVVALLGHNGSGKSTLIKCLVGILKPTTGQILIEKKDVFKYRKKLVGKMGVVFNQKPSFIVDLAVYDNLKYFQAIYNLSNEQLEAQLALIDSHLEIKGLYQKPYRKLSFGERVKCEIASVLLHLPSYIVLDEPTIGLDYNAKRGLYQLLEHYKSLGSTIVIATHEVEYIEGICDKAVIMHKGNVSYYGHPHSITQIVNRGIDIKVKFDELIDPVRAEKYIAQATGYDKEKGELQFSFLSIDQKNEFIKNLVQTISIVSIETCILSIREVLEDVLKEIHKNY